MRSTLPVSLTIRTSRTAPCIGLRRLLAWRAGRYPTRSERMLPASATASSLATASGVLVDAAAERIELRPPGIIIITEIKDIGRPRFDGHFLRYRDVVDVGRADRGINRTIGVRIIDHVHLGPAHPGREPRPARAVLV